MTSRSKSISWAVLGAVLALVLCVPTSAADTKAELKVRFEQRYPQLQQSKKAGKVGENWQGYVEVVEAKFAKDAAIADLIEQENADRTKLYAIIARDQSKDRKVSPAQVAERNARRNFSEAKGHEFLRTRDNIWMQRKEVDELKRRGVVGETWEGYLAVVEGADADSRVKAVLAEDERIRKDEYQVEAKKSRSTLEQVSQKAGEKAIASAAAGEFVKGRDGKWVKK
jgi:uncharacterized protein YdbL (DUF1318 family)